MGIGVLFGLSCTGMNLQDFDARGTSGGGFWSAHHQCRASAGRTISTHRPGQRYQRDDILRKIVACIRVAVPYTGMIISTRESKACRERVLRLGVSQISGGSRTSVGGYAEEEPEEENSAQFDVSDNRTLDQVVRWLMELGYIPSFCTACYREGRTGDRFMSLCKSGQIQNCCHPNALMTLKEYLEDYAAPGTKEIGEKLIQAEIGSIPKEKVQEIVRKNLVEIEKGQRDFRF